MISNQTLSLGRLPKSEEEEGIGFSYNSETNEGIKRVLTKFSFGTT